MMHNLQFATLDKIPDHLATVGVTAMEAWGLYDASYDDNFARTKQTPIAYFGTLPFSVVTNTKLVWFSLERETPPLAALRRARKIRDFLFEDGLSSYVATVLDTSEKDKRFAEFMGFEPQDLVYQGFRFYRREVNGY